MIIGVLGLAVGWRWERVGGAVTVISQMLVVISLLGQDQFRNEVSRLRIPFTMVFSIMVPGCLFLVSWYQSRSKVGG
jgi:hypothetical protein